MKSVIVLLVCFILQISISVPIENVLTEKSQPKIFRNPESKFNTQIIKSDEETALSEIDSPAADKKEYIFLGDVNGISFVIDSATFEVINSFYLYDVESSNIAVVGDTFYNIYTLNGTILSTAVENLIQDPSNIIWKHVGSFPLEKYYIRGGATVDGSLIYFVTYSGNVYLYDTVSRLVTKIGVVEASDSYASLIVLNNILYIYKYRYFYSYNGEEINSIATPEYRYYPGLFKMGNNVCIVGGNDTEIYPDPVYCYNHQNGEWTTPSYINEARRRPGVASTESKTYIFGGLADFSSSNMTDFWRNSIEVLNHETNIWSFAPTPLNEYSKYIEAVVFYS